MTMCQQRVFTHLIAQRLKRFQLGLPTIMDHPLAHQRHESVIVQPLSQIHCTFLAVSANQTTRSRLTSGGGRIYTESSVDANFQPALEITYVEKEPEC